MSIKYNGTIEDLRDLLKTTPGIWSPKLNGKHVFRSNDGGVLNWWPSTGTIQLQGNSRGLIVLENILSCHIGIPLNSMKANNTQSNLKLIIQHNKGGAAEAVQVYMKLQQFGLENIYLESISIEQV